jgi:alcohol dehydrogenase (NADP+)
LIRNPAKIKFKNHKMGEVTLGGYSTSITVREEFVVRIPDQIPLAKAGPLLCAGITTYSPLVEFGARAGGSGFRTGVLGFGGLGHMAVKLAKAMGNRVTVISRGRKKEAAARAAGADEFLDSKNRKDLKKARGKFDLLINTVSANHPLRRYMALLAVDGTMCLVGAPPNGFKVQAFDLIGGRKRLVWSLDILCFDVVFMPDRSCVEKVGSAIGGIRETREMLHFCAKNGITPSVEVIPAKDVNKAYHRLHKV